jgi:hypothetical protein
VEKLVSDSSLMFFFLKNSDEFKICENKSQIAKRVTLSGHFLTSYILNCKWSVSHQTIRKEGKVGEDEFCVRKYLSIFLNLGVYARNPKKYRKSRSSAQHP